MLRKAQTPPRSGAPQAVRGGSVWASAGAAASARIAPAATTAPANVVIRLLISSSRSRGCPHRHVKQRDQSSILPPAPVATGRGAGDLFRLRTAAGSSLRKRIGPQLEVNDRTAPPLAPLDMPVEVRAVVGPQTASLPAGIGIVDASVEPRGRKSRAGTARVAPPILRSPGAAPTASPTRTRARSATLVPSPSVSN